MATKVITADLLNCQAAGSKRKSKLEFISTLTSRDDRTMKSACNQPAKCPATDGNPPL